ncbi:MAG: sulfatase [Sphingopyxis sp.]|nr:sulfatase [Sphingopyxis sp.]
MIARILAALALLLAIPSALNARDRPPNFVIILADDLGYGDLGAYGQHAIRTPHIDRLARQGVRLTDFYAAANICTPSRAGLLTGRYPIRTGLGHEVIQANDTRGLPPSEVTIPELLAPLGYTSALIGKWHLGHVAPSWPPRVHGFDQYFGLPYSHDMKPLAMYDDRAAGVDYIKRDTVNFAQLTREFTDGAVKFIDQIKDKRFFLMVAHTAPHLPLAPHAEHKGHSAAHAYGDVVEEFDASVGAVMAALKRNGVDRDTLVIVTSDNGPWFEGDPGGLHGRKGGAGFDGGYRVPFIAHYPARIRGGRSSNAIAMGIDLLPTIAALAGAKLPAGIEIDGRDIGPVLTRGAPTPHDHLVLFNNEDVAGIRTQAWKLVLRNQYRTLDVPLAAFGYTPLFDMAKDPGERFAANQSAPDVVAALRKLADTEKARFAPLRTRPEKAFAPPKD